MRQDTQPNQASQGETAPRVQPITGYVTEMFCSVQGEGLYVGERHLFVRMAGCTATCYWCDTAGSKEERGFCVVHGEQKRSLPNPLTIDQTIGELLRLVEETEPARVSITGGEPLEQPDFVAALAKKLGQSRIQVYLETNGLEVDGLRKVRPFVDIFAMDIKLPSATGEVHWRAHGEFLKWLIGKNVFVKIVVDSPTPLEEIETAIHLIAEIDRRVPLVLQPESATYLKEARGPVERQVLSNLLDEAHRIALRSLDNVRVIPQCHKIMRVR
jgi:organic radical activating enzyme